VIEVKVTIRTCAGVPHDVRANVDKRGPGRYEVEWCDRAGLLALCFTPAQLHYLRRRCEEAYDVTERDRTEIDVLLEAGIYNHLRDTRNHSEVCARI
jgi:hypothetical protein